jgi:hypothetical protein
VSGSSFLDKTDQTWKRDLEWLFWVGFCLIGWGVSQSAHRTLSGILAVAGFVIVVGAFACPILSIRCPDCRSRVYWRAMREQRLSDFEPWLDAMTHCPVCGSDGRTRDETASS